MIFGLFAGSQARFPRRTRGEHMSTRSRLSVESPFIQRAHPLPATPFQCPRSRTATLKVGSRGSYLPLRGPDCTLSRFRAEEYDQPVTQSIATPEPSSRTIHTLDRTLFTRKSLECVTTPRSRRLVQGELPPITPEY